MKITAIAMLVASMQAVSIRETMATQIAEDQEQQVDSLALGDGDTKVKMTKEEREAAKAARKAARKASIEAAKAKR